MTTATATPTLADRIAAVKATAQRRLADERDRNRKYEAARQAEEQVASEAIAILADSLAGIETPAGKLAVERRGHLISLMAGARCLCEFQTQSDFDSGTAWLRCLAGNGRTPQDALEAAIAALERHLGMTDDDIPF